MSKESVNTEYLIPISIKEILKCDIRDFSKLDIRDGKIYCFIYMQDGTKQPMVYEDTFTNRCFISWLQIHDRYIGTGVDNSSINVEEVV